MTTNPTRTAPPLEDYRVTVARQALAELPPAEDNERPYFWLGRLKTALQLLVDGWPSGVPGGLDGGQREVLASALADALAYRSQHADGPCSDCDADPSLLCCEGAADLDLADAYEALAGELGIEPERHTCETCGVTVTGGVIGPDGLRWLCDAHREPEPAPDDEGPVFITMDMSSPKPPYGTPERAALDEARCAKCHAEPCKDGSPFCARCLDICHEALEFDHCCMICATPEEARALGFRVVSEPEEGR